MHHPAVHFDDEKDVVAPERHGVDVEEVGGQDALGLGTKDGDQVGPSRRGAGGSR
jgi:hypothetical protein